jgi:hypothetical protein
MTMQQHTDDVSLALNKLAREQIKLKLLADILTDMTICKIEGWNPMEYVFELHGLLADIIKKQKIEK